MRWAILDSNVYINHWERGLNDDTMLAVRSAFIVRQSSVVLSELRRGARTPDAQRLVEELFRLAKTPWVPTAEDWWRAGLVIRKLGDANHWDLRKRQLFQNDALIALTARRHGATVVTANHRDFELLHAELAVQIFLV